MPMDLSDWHLWYKRRGGRQLRTLLMDNWDPIGVRGVPEAIDEYDGYVSRIADGLRRGADVDQVAAMLSNYRTDAMSLGSEPETDAAAARAIVDWYTESMRDASVIEADSKSHSDLTTVYVMLVDESVDVWRPVPAAEIGNGQYKLFPSDGYDPKDETWEFPPGATVECEPRMLSEGVVLVATRLVTSASPAAKSTSRST